MNLVSAVNDSHTASSVLPSSLGCRISAVMTDLEIEPLDKLLWQAHGSWSRTAVGLNGKIPQDRKPLIMLAGFIVFSHASKTAD